MNSVSGRSNSFLPIPPQKVCLFGKSGEGLEIKQPWEAHGSKTALFLMPQRRLALLGDSHPGTGALKALVPRQPCHALLETAPGAGAGFEGQPFCSTDEESESVCSSIPTSGDIPKKLKAGS